MKVKLNDVLEGLEMGNGEVDCYYNPETQEIFLSNIGDFTDLNEDELDELFEKSIMLPTQNEIHEYSMMENFIETIDDEKLQRELYIGINGSGAFRRFKDTCIKFDIINEWYKFRDKRYREIAINWCKENNIEVEM